MLSADQKDFYNRWLAKADDIQGGDISSLIDKYITLFIIYNFLYNIVPKTKAEETGEPRAEIKDRQGATTITIDFMGADIIYGYLSEDRLDHEIVRLANAIPHFNINLNKGKKQPAKDKALIDGLQSDDSSKKILALMNTLYSVRCNIVHGEKSLHQYQAMLLVPSIKLLRAIVPLVFNRVNR